jgi:hypothetical protein
VDDPRWDFGNPLSERSGILHRHARMGRANPQPRDLP